MSRSTWDYLIVGQGLAGSLLAWTLLRRGLRVMVVDDQHRGSSSMVAAGMINPLAGMRFSKALHMTQLLSAAHRRYADFEQTFGRRYYHALPMVRLFRSDKQKRFWDKRVAEPDSADLLGPAFAAGASGHDIAAPHGGFRQRQTGYLEVASLLHDIQHHLADAGYWTKADIDYSGIDPETGVLPGIPGSAATIVFCEGYRMRHNPWFDWLPMLPHRGEILTFASPQTLPDEIINGVQWLIPLGDGRYRVGSTFDRHKIDCGPTAQGKARILAGLTELLGRDVAPRIDTHQSGVRPVTQDHYPLLGRHVNLPRLAVCNGFGARGSLTIPWYVERLADHLEQGLPLPAEADISRCV